MNHEQAHTPDRDRNPDAISGAADSHPVGTGLGALGGGAAGAALGAVIAVFAAPLGAALGAVAGAIAGGLAGKRLAQASKPTTDEDFWRDRYAAGAYVEPGDRFDDFRPAYHYGWESANRNRGATFAEVEPMMARDWPMARGESELPWERAREAARDAWERVERRRDELSAGKSAAPC